MPISHAFLAARGNNRNERVSLALDKVGVPILNGAVASMAGMAPLAFAHSYVFQTFFKAMMLVVLLGTVHSLCFLPVLLSFIGPKRTSRPRVFLPPGLMESLFLQKSSEPATTDVDKAKETNFLQQQQHLIQTVNGNGVSSDSLATRQHSLVESASNLSAGSGLKKFVETTVLPTSSPLPLEVSSHLTTSLRRTKFAKSYQISKENQHQLLSGDYAIMSFAHKTSSQSSDSSFKSFDTVENVSNSTTLTPYSDAVFYSFDDVDNNFDTFSAPKEI